MLAPDIHGPFDASQEFTFSLLDNLENAREVQTTGGVGISPTETALQFYGSRHMMIGDCRLPTGLRGEEFENCMMRRFRLVGRKDMAGLREHHELCAGNTLRD